MGSASPLHGGRPCRGSASAQSSLLLRAISVARVLALVSFGKTPPPRSALHLLKEQPLQHVRSACQRGESRGSAGRLGHLLYRLRIRRSLSGSAPRRDRGRDKPSGEATPTKPSAAPLAIQRCRLPHPCGRWGVSSR